MSNLRDIALRRSSTRLGIYIVAIGFFINALAYGILVLQFTIQRVPKGIIWTELIEAAFALGWLTVATGTFIIAASLRPRKDNHDNDRDREGVR